MGLNLAHFREYIVQPTLKAVDLWSLAAENLIVGTALVESNLEYVRQINGPALSLLQIEPLTHKDLRNRVIIHYPELHEKIKDALHMRALPMSPNYLMGNLNAAVIFARLKYYFHPDPLPQADDFQALAQYHKKIYNSPLGAANVAQTSKLFRLVTHGAAAQPRDSLFT